MNTTSAAVVSSRMSLGSNAVLVLLALMALTGCGGGGGGFPVEAVAAAEASTTPRAASPAASSAVAALVIRRQPVSLEVREGEVAQFSVVADGPRSIAYQWLRDGEPIEGATGSLFQLLAGRDDDRTRISVSLSAGQVATQSATALLRVGAN